MRYFLASDADGVVRSYVTAEDDQEAAVEVEADVFADALSRLGLCRLVDGALVAYAPPPPPLTVPDRPTLSDWRVGLLLWRTPTGNRRDELDAKVADLVQAGNIMGEIAKERSQYANEVFRAQLMQLAGVLGFSEAEIDESLWRADRVRRGDLSGEWPLPAA